MSARNLMVKCLGVAVLLNVAGTSVASAQTLSVYLSRYSSQYAYGSGLGYYTNALQTAFGGAQNIQTIGSLGAPITTTSLIVELGNYPNETLTAGEISNLQGYIAAGHRVLFQGENYLWTNWNTSFLSVVGGTDCSTTGYSNAPGLTVVQNAITAGVNGLFTQGAPGCAAGGTQLFSNTFATLYGTNVLANMDVNTIDDSAIGAATNAGYGNAQYVTNVAVWLATPTTTVPEPGSLALVGAGFAALLLVKVRRRH